MNAKAALFNRVLPELKAAAPYFTTAAIARRVQELGQELIDRFETLRGHFERVGNGLNSAIKAFDDTVGSFASNLLPQARRFKELGAGGKKELGTLEPINRQARKLPEASD